MLIKIYRGKYRGTLISNVYKFNDLANIKKLISSIEVLINYISMTRRFLNCIISSENKFINQLIYWFKVYKVYWFL